MPAAKVVYEGPAPSAAGETLFTIMEERRKKDLQLDLFRGQQEIEHTNRLAEQSAKQKFDMAMENLRHQNTLAAGQQAEGFLRQRAGELGGYVEGQVGMARAGGAPIPSMEQEGPLPPGGMGPGSPMPKPIAPGAAPGALEMLKSRMTEQHAEKMTMPWELGLVDANDLSTGSKLADLMDKQSPGMGAALRVSPGTMTKSAYYATIKDFTTRIYDNDQRMARMVEMNSAKDLRAADANASRERIEKLKAQPRLDKMAQDELFKELKAVNDLMSRAESHHRTLVIDRSNITNTPARNAMLDAQIAAAEDEKRRLAQLHMDALALHGKAIQDQLTPEKKVQVETSEENVQANIFRKAMPGFDQATPEQRKAWYLAQPPKKQQELDAAMAAAVSGSRYNQGFNAPTEAKPPAPAPPEGDRDLFDAIRKRHGSEPVFGGTWNPNTAPWGKR